MNKKPRKTKKEMKKTTNLLASLGRIIAGSYYDHQEVRIREMSRVRDIIRKKIEGINLAGETEKKKKKNEKYKEKYKDSEIPTYLKELLNRGKMTEKEKAYVERILDVQKNAKKYEDEYKKLMMEFVEGEPIYTEFLKHIKGISAVLSANLIKELGYCEGAPHISSVWAFAGLHLVCPDCVEERKDEHGNKKKYRIVAEYNGRCPKCGKKGIAPRRERGFSLLFNPRVRVLAWKIADSFIKQRTPFYREIYDTEKARQLKMLENNDSHLKQETHEIEASQKEKETHRLRASQFPKETHEIEASHLKKETHSSKATLPKNKMHIELRARRKMVKIFLAHYWQACKELSHVKKETHLDEASHRIEETRQNKASHVRKETHEKEASHCSKETHLQIAKPYVQEKLGHRHISSWKEAVAINKLSKLKTGKTKREKLKIKEEE